LLGFSVPPRLRRLTRTLTLVVGVLAAVGFAMRIGQGMGIVTINLDSEQKTAECVVLERAMADRHLEPIDFVTAGCSQNRVRAVLVDRMKRSAPLVAGEQR